MKFFSSNTLANTSQHGYSNMFLMPIRAKTPSISTPVIITEAPSSTPEKKVKWGEPTWFLFHTLSVKIKDEYFQLIRVDLLNQIYAICINLPCPDCANHAKTYLDGINFNAIQTKNDLKHMLHDFHNEVNRRKNYSFFPFENVDEKYSKAITTNIIQNFMLHFSDRNRSLKLLPTDLYRQRLCVNLKVWFNTHITQFNP
jgi:hypothetical protein